MIQGAFAKCRLRRVSSFGVEVHRERAPGYDLARVPVLFICEIVWPYGASRQTKKGAKANQERRQDKLEKASRQIKKGVKAN